MEKGSGHLFIRSKSSQLKKKLISSSICIKWFNSNWINKLYSHDSLLMNLYRVLSSYTTFGNFGLSTSVLGYFNKVVAIAFLISSLIEYENSASGMCFGD